jgi:hypothetical protein
MASLVLAGDTSGSITVSAPAVAGSNTQTLVAATDTLAPIIRGTAVTCAGQTSIEFTSIPSWVKRITVMFSGVSTSGTSVVQVQLGATTYTTSGYNSIGTGITGATVSSVTNNSTGFGIGNEGGTAASSRVGTFVFTNISGTVWTAMFQYAFSDTTRAIFGSGNVTLGGTLERVRVTTANGTDTFDTTPSAGTINILYE